MKRTLTIRPILSEKEVFRLENTLFEYRKAFGLYSESAVQLHATSRIKVQKRAYVLARTECPALPSSLVQGAGDCALEAVRSYNSNNPKKKWTKTPSAAKMRTMRYNARTLSLRGNLLTLSTTDKRLRTLIEIPGFFRERWLDNAASWKCKAGTVTISKRSRVIIHLVFTIEVPDVEAEGDVLGCDRGLYNIIATSDGELMSAKTTRATRRRYAYDRRTLQQKGTRSAKRRLKAISGREKRFVHNENHCLSKRLASRPDVSTLVFEDLSKVGRLKQKANGKSNRTMRTWLSGWAYADLEAKTEYKCKRNGIEVVFVDPRNTSITCPVCGHVDSNSRHGHRFVCTACGHSDHADVNASKNIRARYLANLTQAMQSGQAAVNRPGEPSGHPANGWGAAGEPATESAGKTLTSKPSG